MSFPLEMPTEQFRIAPSSGNTTSPLGSGYPTAFPHAVRYSFLVLLIIGGASPYILDRKEKVLDLSL
jgi:hypothetical protein